jgi:hypothetical protein
MEYSQGPYIKTDLKRLKKIKSLETDLENHFKIFRGKVGERINGEYNVPLAQAFLYETEVDSVKVYFYKDRSATTNPFMSPRSGLRIVFALFVKDREILKYIPFIVFLAKEEGDRYNCPDNNKYPLKSSSFKKIIESKLKYL